MALLGHELEADYQSLDYVDNPSFNKEENIIQYMKANGEGKVTEETCPKCSIRHFSAYRQEFMRVKAASCSATTRTVICLMNALKMKSGIGAKSSYW